MKSKITNQKSLIELVLSILQQLPSREGLVVCLFCYRLSVLGGRYWVVGFRLRSKDRLLFICRFVILVMVIINNWLRIHSTFDFMTFDFIHSCIRGKNSPLPTSSSKPKAELSILLSFWLYDFRLYDFRLYLIRAFVAKADS